MGFGERCKLPQRGPQPQTIFVRYICNFVRFHACFIVFWNLTGNADKTINFKKI